jgi:hypothetical protein
MIKIQYFGWLWAGLLVSSSLCAQQNSVQNTDDLVYDFFTGTLQLVAHTQSVANKSGNKPALQLQLNRCDLGQNQYWLLDNEDHTVQQFIQTYEKQLKLADGSNTSADHKIQATVIGAYQEKEGENYLVVKSIEEVQPDTSCHLMDMFS